MAAPLPDLAGPFVLPGSVGEIVADGNLVLAVLVALAAGALSFASPCVLPLVPGFLGYVTGLGAKEQEAARSRVVLGAALFVLGFSIVFLAVTVLASALGLVLATHRRALSVVGGVVVLAMAAVFAGFAAQGSWAPRWRPATGLAGAPLLGMVFALGWAPCMGPTLAVIITLATTTVGDGGVVARGVALGVAYCLGLGLPFLAIAAGWSRAVRASGWLRRHHRALQLGGAALLAAVGLLLLTGWWDQMVVWWQVRLVGSTTLPL